MSDVRRHHQRPTARSSSWARAVGVRLTGLLLYVAVVAWSAWQLPTSLPFVVPAAVAGLLLHAMKGRPWLGLILFVILVVGLPALLAPALGVGTFSDFGNWFDSWQW
jgi:hypothetical protein